MLIKFINDNGEETLIDNVKSYLNFRFCTSKNYYSRDGKLVYGTPDNYLSVDFDIQCISNERLNLLAKDCCVPCVRVDQMSGDSHVVIFHEGFVMNNDGKTIDRL
jgi:hypothetical protein